MQFNNNVPHGNLSPEGNPFFPEDLTSEEGTFICKMACDNSMDIAAAREKVQYMKDMYPENTKDKTKKIYSWIEENWDNYHLISF